MEHDHGVVRVDRLPASQGGQVDGGSDLSDALGNVGRDRRLAREPVVEALDLPGRGSRLGEVGDGVEYSAQSGRVSVV
jgi:hypothetical protein